MLIEKPKLNFRLRTWQQECLFDQVNKINKGQKTYFLGAGVGSGKTLASLATFMVTDFDMMIVVTPKSGIRGSWHKDAAKVGLTFETLTSESIGMDGDNFEFPNGYVLNIHAVPSLVYELTMLCSKFRVMLVVDEAHHFGEDMFWTNNVVSALSGAAYTLLLSGTPYRSDDQKILGLTYNRDSAEPDYLRSYNQNLSSGEAAPIVTRFVSGSVEKIMDDGRSEVFDYDDGDYSSRTGKKNVPLMSERLRLTAIESFEWQMGAVSSARTDLIRFRQDGIKWGGLVVCRTIEQATQLAGLITSTFGDKVKLIVAEADTEESVSDFIADDSYVWVVSITKVSEGINIDRLRVGVMLTSITTRGNFDQVRGRLVRLVPGVAHLSQTAHFYIPADPRLIDYALSSNQSMLHAVPWIGGGESDTESLVKLHDELTEGSDYDVDGTAIDRIETTGEMINDLREELYKSRKAITVNVGRYTLSARAVIDGAAINDEFVPEDEYLSLRNKLAGIINPMTAMRASGKALLEMTELFEEAHG